MTQVEALAKYAARKSFADLSVQSRRELPVYILDSRAASNDRLWVSNSMTRTSAVDPEQPVVLLGS
jgi:hypothetical protein